MKRISLNARAAVVSLLLLVCFLGLWQLGSTAVSVGGSAAGLSAEEIEYLEMMGAKLSVRVDRTGQEETTRDQEPAASQ
jgi:hypothetical protein